MPGLCNFQSGNVYDESSRVVHDGVVLVSQPDLMVRRVFFGAPHSQIISRTSVIPSPTISFFFGILRKRLRPEIQDNLSEELELSLSPWLSMYLAA
ncbi:hypothetical protein V6N13_033226 [Hibiscus sabdariffa]|uniref:Uncharacterized protein n=1 Tax=Hibiscus sabdariffa TaxID=183260 RepID=A0ABR2FB26_9ROSI